MDTQGPSSIRKRAGEQGEDRRMAPSITKSPARTTDRHTKPQVPPTSSSRGREIAGWRHTGKTRSHPARTPYHRTRNRDKSAKTRRGVDKWVYRSPPQQSHCAERECDGSGFRVLSREIMCGAGCPKLACNVDLSEGWELPSGAADLRCRRIPSLFAICTRVY